LPRILVKKSWQTRHFMQISSGKSRGKSRESETPLLKNVFTVHYLKGCFHVSVIYIAVFVLIYFLVKPRYYHVVTIKTVLVLL
jgi:hypothetical protein